MKSSYAYQIPGSDQEVLVLLRSAALDILRKSGWEGPAMWPYSETAYAAGLFVAYFGTDPGTLSRRDRTTWDSPIEEVEDDLQHVVEIKIGEQVACFGWRGDGPIEIDHLRRGPWEFELLKAAGMSASIPEGSLPPAPLAPEPMSHWTLEGALDPFVYSRQIEKPLAITVVRHGLQGEGVVVERSSFPDLRAVLEGCYATTCEKDDKPYAKGDPTSCFSLEVRIVNTDHNKYRGCPRAQPLLRYFIGSDDALSLAAALLLAYDYDDERQTFERRERYLTMPVVGEEQGAPTVH